jgi:arylsulfatase A-like enzyme
MADYSRPLKASWRAGIALLVSLLLSSCTPEPIDKSDDSHAGLDLIPLYQVARLDCETGGIDLLSQEANYNLKGGWSEPYETERGDAEVAAVASESVLRYQVLRTADRWLECTVHLDGKFGSLSRQRITVEARKQALATYELSAGEAKVILLRIPSAMQTPGNNRIYFRFSEFEQNPDFMADRKKRQENPYRGLAAYFSAFNLYLGDENGPRRGEIRSQSEFFRMVAGGRYLAQAPDSAIAYAFELGPGATLDLEGIVQGRKEGETLEAAIEVRTDEKPGWNRLWSRSFGPERVADNDFSARIELDDIAGGAAEIRLLVESPGGYSDAAVVWKRLRLDVAGIADPSAGRRPARLNGRVRNVVIIVLDAARPDHFGCYGDERGLTPHIDSFAGESLVFRTAIAAAPYTIASVASILTGLVPESHGVRYYESALPEDLPTLQEAFKRGGFFTLVMSGNPFITYKLGMTRGFDEEIYLRSEEAKQSGRSTMDLVAIERGVETAAASGKPVFIYCHLLPPHWPYSPPPPFDDKFTSGDAITRAERRMMRVRHDASPADPAVARLHSHYMNNSYYADHLTQQLLEMLREHGLYDDSLIIVTADHGEAFAEHGALGHGNTVHDEMVLVPFIARVPGTDPGEIEQQVGLIDLFPTFVELFSLDAGGAHLEGRSLASIFAGGEPGEAPYYYSRATGDKLIFTLRGERYKYIHFDPREELYDLQSDPAELKDIIEQRPVLAAVLRQRGLMIVAAGVASERATLAPEDQEELRNLGYLH